MSSTINFAKKTGINHETLPKPCCSLPIAQCIPQEPTPPHRPVTKVETSTTTPTSVVIQVDDISVPHCKYRARMIKNSIQTEQDPKESYPLSSSPSSSSVLSESFDRMTQVHSRIAAVKEAKLAHQEQKIHHNQLNDSRRCRIIYPSPSPNPHENLIRKPDCTIQPYPNPRQRIDHPLRPREPIHLRPLPIIDPRRPIVSPIISPPGRPIISPPGRPIISPPGRPIICPPIVRPPRCPSPRLPLFPRPIIPVPIDVDDDKDDTNSVQVVIKLNQTKSINSSFTLPQVIKALGAFCQELGLSVEISSQNIQPNNDDTQTNDTEPTKSGQEGGDDDNDDDDGKDDFISYPGLFDNDDNNAQYPPLFDELDSNFISDDACTMTISLQPSELPNTEDVIGGQEASIISDITDTHVIILPTIHDTQPTTTTTTTADQIETTPDNTNITDHSTTNTTPADASDATDATTMVTNSTDSDQIVQEQNNENNHHVESANITLLAKLSTQLEQFMALRNKYKQVLTRAEEISPSDLVNNSRIVAIKSRIAQYDRWIDSIMQQIDQLDIGMITDDGFDLIA